MVLRAVGLPLADLYRDPQSGSDVLLRKGDCELSPPIQHASHSLPEASACLCLTAWGSGLDPHNKTTVVLAVSQPMAFSSFMFSEVAILSRLPQASPLHMLARKGNNCSLFHGYSWKVFSVGTKEVLWKGRLGAQSLGEQWNSQPSRKVWGELYNLSLRHIGWQGLPFLLVVTVPRK